MKPTEIEILEALKANVKAADIVSDLPAINDTSLMDFFDNLSGLLNPSDKVEIYIDGASDGDRNGGIGVRILNNGAEKNISHSIGKATNNEAEYFALLEGVNVALKNNFKNIVIYSDSELLVKQINGEYKVKAKNLIPLKKQVDSALGKIKNYSLEWIPREQNKAADSLAKNGTKL